MGFLSKIRNNMRKMPRRPEIISDMRFRGEMPRDGGFGFGLGEAIRRLKEKRGGDMGMPRMEGSIGRLPGMGSIINDPFSAPFKGEINEAALQARAPRMPRMNFGDQIRYTRPNKDPSMPIAFNDPSFRMIGTPQPIPERMPTDPSSYYNPTIFGQPIGDMDFSQMPKISPEDMMNLQVPTQMPMTQDLPEVAPVGMMPQMRLENMSPRMMMAEGS